MSLLDQMRIEGLRKENARAWAEVNRLRAILRVNGLRWGHTHAEIDKMIAEQGENNRCI